MKYLYADGGVILKNPSTIGGTWAWCLIDNNEIVKSDGGIIIHTDVVQFPDGLVTNNQTELFAILQGISQLKCEDVIEIRSDSEITLGRVFKGYSLNNIPLWMKCSLEMEKKRLKNFQQFKYTLMDGHPTQAQIDKGFGKRGHMTSKWNVWCDKECGRQARLYLESLAVPA